MKENFNIFEGHPIDNIAPIIGKSDDADYIIKYLKEIKATFCLEEKNYIDKEFLIDYSKFYARSFDDPKKYTTRLHFFKNEITKTEFHKLLEDFNKGNFGQSQLKKINKDYLGFVIVKPILDSDENPLLGRTLLQPYPHKEGNDRREHLKKEYQISLYGLPLTITSLPFQMQDQSVGACATTSCWVSLYPLNNLFGTPIHALAEITEKSVTFPSLDRNFPSSGLSVFQIKNFYNSLGLETEYIDINRRQLKEKYGRDHTIVPTLVKAYIDFGLPIIACLKIYKVNNPTAFTDYDPHAVVISGYRHTNGLVKEMYVHDDRIGPYSRVEPISRRSKNLFIDWKCEWLNRKYDVNTDEKYKKVMLESLIIPIYPKLRLKFMDMYVIFSDYIKKTSRINPNMSYQLILKELNCYKAYLLEKNFSEKSKILMRRFPHYVWIIRICAENTIVHDTIFDATCNYQTGEPFGEIDFK